MSDLLPPSGPAREPLQAAFDEETNPIGVEGVEFIEYATAQPQALGHVLEKMGFRPVARHRSREVLLYRQSDLNIVVDAHGVERSGLGATAPAISAIAWRVRDAAAAHRHMLDHGGWEVPAHPAPMELHIPAILGVGGTRIYLVDRHREFSIYDVDFVPIPSVDVRPPAVAGLGFFGLVQYIGHGRIYDWIEFYQRLLGLKLIPDEQRFGILPAGKLLRAPVPAGSAPFFLQLIEPEPDVDDHCERLHRIGLSVPDVPAAVTALRALGIEFVETQAAHTARRGAVTKTYLDAVMFELVHSEVAA